LLQEQQKQQQEAEMGSLTDSCASLCWAIKDLATHDKASGAQRANVLIYWLWVEEEKTRET
jgi:hypothetical protein